MIEREQTEDVDALADQVADLRREKVALERSEYERQQAEETLQRSEDKYRRLVDGLRRVCFFFACQPTGEITYASPSVTDILGHEPRAMVGDLTDLLVEDSSVNEGALEEFRKLFGAEHKDPLLLEFRDAGGESRLLELVDVSAREEGGGPREGIAIDVTERLRAETAVLRSSDRFRRLAEALQDEYFFYERDRAGTLTRVSPSVRGLLGYEPEEFRDGFDDLLTDSPLNQDARKALERALEGEPSDPHPIEILDADGRERVLEVCDLPRVDATGMVTAVDGLARDASERQRIEEALDWQVEADALALRHSARLMDASDESALDETLESLGRFLGVDRVWLARPNADGDLAVERAWCEEDAQEEPRGVLPLGPSSWSGRRLEAGEPVGIGGIDGLPTEAAEEREFLESRDVSAALWIPVAQDEELATVLGIESVRDEWDWTDRETRLAQRLAHTVTETALRLNTSAKSDELRRENLRLRGELDDEVARRTAEVREQLTRQLVDAQEETERRVRETRAELESDVELAREDAQERLNRLREEAENETTRIRAEAERNREELRKAAARREEQLRAEAEEREQRLQAEAEQRQEELREEAERRERELRTEADEREQRAQREAREREEEARREADERVQKAEEEAAERVREAEEEIERVRAEVRDEIDQRAEKARAEAEAAREEAEQQARQAEERARGAEEEVRAAEEAARAAEEEARATEERVRQAEKERDEAERRAADVDAEVERHTAEIRDELQAEIESARRDVEEARAAATEARARVRAELEKPLDVLGRVGSEPLGHTAPAVGSVTRLLRRTVGAGPLADPDEETTEIPLATLVEGMAGVVRQWAADRPVEVTLSPPRRPFVVEGRRLFLQDALTDLVTTLVDQVEGGSIAFRIEVEEAPPTLVVRATAERATAADDGLPPGLEPLQDRLAEAGARLAVTITEDEIGAPDEAEAGAPGATRLEMELPLDGVDESPDSLPAGGVKGRRILVVDDHHGSRNALADALERRGAEVETASSGPAALTLFQDAAERSETRPWDLLLIDWDMSGMDGIETTSRIEGQSGLPAPPAVLMGNPAEASDVRRRAELGGFVGALIKPAPDALDAIRQALGDEAAAADATRAGTVAADGTEDIQVFEPEDTVANGFGKPEPAPERTPAWPADGTGGMQDALAEVVDRPAWIDEQPARVAVEPRDDGRAGFKDDPRGLRPATGTAAAPSDTASGFDIPALDAEFGLARVDGDEARYRDLLLQFRDDYIEADDELDRALESGFGEAALEQARRVRERAEEIGAMDVRDAAGEMAGALEEGRTHRLPELQRSFARSLTRLVDSLVELEGSRSGSGPTPVDVEDLRDSSPAGLARTLDELAQALGSRRPRRCRLLARRVRGQDWPDELEDDVNRLLTLVERYRFDEAEEMAETLQQRLDT